MARTLFEACVLLGLAAAVGLGFNASRKDKPIDLRRDYFPKMARRAPDVPPDAGAGAADVEDGEGVSEASRAPSELPPHDFKVLEAEDVAGYVNMADSSIVLVDARNDEHFKKGHILGALQFDHFFPNEYLPDLLAVAEYADIIIIYCNGGKCEDSIATANYLTSEIPNPLPFDDVYVYEGGMKEWCELQYPIEGECE